MKKRLVALGMAAVMVVGGSVMAFGQEHAADRDSDADIELVLDLPPVIEEPDDDDDLPGGPDPYSPRWYALMTMDLDFGARDIRGMNFNGASAFNTLDRQYVGFGDAVYREPLPAGRVMAVALQNDIAFRVNVHRSHFTDDDDVTTLVGADFNLVRYQTPTFTDTPDHHLTTVANPGAYLLVGIGDVGSVEIANSSSWGRYVMGFSGNLSGVELEAVPHSGEFTAILTWTMGPLVTGS